MQSMETIPHLPVGNLRKGDVFNPDGSGWIAVADAKLITQPNGDQDIMVDVQFMPDGGFGHRAWPVSQNQTLKVHRP